MSDVIVIGSGLGGLSCAYILQKNGYRVTVLEQESRIGGCLQCFRRGGVKFETGMHFIGSAAPGQTMDRMFEYFGLKDSVVLSPLDTSAYNTVSLSGKKFGFPNGREAFIRTMSDYFPREKDGLVKYMDIADRIAEASSLESLVSPNRDIAANTEYQTRSINDVLDSLFSDELLKNVLVGDGPLYAAQPDKTPFSLHAFIMNFYNRSAFRIVGGSDVIASTLASGIENEGGRILTDSRVKRIVCSDTAAVGVETEGEQFFHADYVISAVHPARMLEMLDTKLIRPAFRSRLNSIPQTSSIFAVYLKFREDAMPYMNTNYFGYSKDSIRDGVPCHPDVWPDSFLYMHFCHEANPVYAKCGIVFAYMDYAEVARWYGTSVGRRGPEYEAFKKVKAEKLMAAVERQLPGFAGTVEDYWTSTPLTYADYTGTEAGSMYGVAKDISLGPAGRVPYRTRIPNLFLAGQNVNSHGILGVIVGSIVTCSEFVSAGKILGGMSDKKW